MVDPGAAPQATVLIVDDDDGFRQSTARILGAAGFGCESVPDGAAARARLEEHTFEAVLCDIRMPGESGVELLAALGSDHPDVAVVMTTGVEDVAVAELAFELGAFGYLVKPFSSGELVIALVGALRRRELEAAQRSNVHGLEKSLSRLRSLRGVLVGIEEQSGPSTDDEETVGRLARTISLRQDETNGHLERVRRYAGLIASAAGLDDRTAADVQLAAALHDVGKIGVADSVLLKAGPLTATERSVMQRHCRLGYQLLAGSASPVLDLAADIALAHHEWWDGSGYPLGLKGQEINLAARITAVAEVFDALTSDRVYRRAMPVDRAIDVMTELRGRQFEPRLLDALVGSLDEALAIRAAFPEEQLPTRIRVLVVDDHAIFTDSLVRLLASYDSITVVGTATSVAAAVGAAVRHEPDVVLMDFELPDGDGARATERIKALLPETRVVMLTGRVDHDAFVRAITAGCAGFVRKAEPVERLVAAIESAYAGETPAATELPPLLAQLRPTHRGLGADLSARQLEVLQLMVTGAPNKAIARELHISLNTVRNHAQSILYKLDAHSKLEAVATAVREGLVRR